MYVDACVCVRAQYYHLSSSLEECFVHRDRYHVVSCRVVPCGVVPRGFLSHCRASHRVTWRRIASHGPESSYVICCSVAV